MILPDVNVLVHAFRPDASDHGPCRSWLEAGCEWVTLDRDYSRFPGLQWHPPA